MSERILVTGANGFVGRALCATLGARGVAYTGAVRRDPGPHQVAIGDMDAGTDWRAALAGCSCVVHLAARVHVMDDGAADPLAAFRAVNVDATLALARQAVAAGVRRFVFVSSIKVNGEATQATPFRADQAPAPQDPYGVSKWEAEQALTALGRDTGLEIVIVRPPLVYGPGVRANFLRLMQLARKGVPLPLASVDNRRSMVAVDNLADLLALCCRHPAAAGQVLLAADGRDLSVAELLRLLAGAMGKRAPLFPMPVGLMRAGAALLGKGAVADRLLGSLQVDAGPTRALLSWQAPLTVEQGIARTVAHFLQQ